MKKYKVNEWKKQDLVQGGSGQEQEHVEEFKQHKLVPAGRRRETGSINDTQFHSEEHLVAKRLYAILNYV